ncbi:MAG: cysteine--tRNA ligase [Chloroflexaceae bacterium]|nr:cysteine--tRNA ligase [Chloroflexaceae bacterium]NJO06738.1 cysteine--tRNA ligase [Chloroflexaceae bacterium]
MLLYNSYSARKEEFVIPTDRPVTVYVCGVTPYDTTHMGHARTYLVFDVLIRYLRWKGAEVIYCQNVTDIDDPLFERAKRDGVDWRKLAELHTAQFLDDTMAMNMLRPTYYPKASHEIPSMIEIIEHLVAEGYAYVREGNVYYSIDRAEAFGQMAQMNYEQLLETANERGNNPNDPFKEDPLDFVLWQRSKNDEPIWESPWGPGRPGWHIECSAMATRYLGEQIDIHGGGRDLIFPHHSCEIAQSEPYTGKQPFARIWMHTGLVWLGEAKMSKSLGNLVFVRDALMQYDPNVLRWYLLNFSYRKDFSYEEKGVAYTQVRVERVRQALHVSGGSGEELEIEQVRTEFDMHMSNNLRTPYALNALLAGAELVLAAAAEGRTVTAAQSLLVDITEAIGLRLS